MRPSLALLIVALAGAAPATAAPQDALTLSGDAYTLTLSPANGSIVSLTAKGQAGSILASGEDGLWQVRFQDGSVARAADFAAGSPERTFRREAGAGANSVRLRYESQDVVVGVVVTAGAGGLDFTGEVTPRGKTLLEFALPARIRFRPDGLRRFICPASGNSSVGTAFRRAFFEPQPQENPSGWRPEVTGPRGYTSLFGSPLDQGPDGDPPVALRPAANAGEWLPPALAAGLASRKAMVNRPFTRAQADVVVADSANGPYFAASRLGGKGGLWRLGGRVGEGEKGLALDLVGAAIGKLAAAPGGRTKLGLIALHNGPESGGWAGVTAAEWRVRLSRVASTAKVTLVDLATPRAVMDAANGGEFLAILNPYGEWLPAPAEMGIEDAVAAVGRFVRAGGHWFEVGGYSFYAVLRPVRYFTYGVPYPPAFADFLHLDTDAGRASLYRVQPRPWEPWAGAKDRGALFVPGRLAIGGDEKGGYCDRPFATHVAPGETWRAPAVHLAVGTTVEDDLRAYTRANGITRGLNEKMAPEVLDRFKRSVLVYYAGSAREKAEHLHLLPVPTQVHFADYLKGGFDKEYPDHLPPHPRFGTAAEFRAFFDRAHQLGHLVVPYTNPTWWCDGPKGPTFAREGDIPLLKGLDGKPVHERYSVNEGFTICHWHPAVQAANRETVRQFSEDFPVDVLFQDQCGARTWRYDTNPASPTPYAYAEGLISMVDEDARRKPLSTESGWDRVVNGESQLCGLSWQIVPTEGGPEWRRLMKTEYPPHTWEVFPLAQHIAHDKTAMLYHDLGQFVTTREVLAWTVGLGFCTSYRAQAQALTRDAPREWLRWLDRVQKSVCARYVGEPVRAFTHDRGPQPTMEDDGVMRAAYGPVQVVANLGPNPRRQAGRALPPYGFHATAPGMVAANLARVGTAEFGEEGISFVAEGDGRKADVWVYAPAGAEVAVELPAGLAGEVSVAFDGQPAARARVQGNTLGFRLPARDAAKRQQPPATLAGKAPRDWPGGPAAIGVLDLGEAVRPTWTRITAAEWVRAFSESRLARQHRVPVRRIGSGNELLAALQAGPTAWLAIINPYGEGFPVEDPARWREMLDRVRAYVNAGGCWWETGGYSFHTAITLKDGARQSGPVGPAGVAALGLPIGSGDVEQPEEPLRVPAEGGAWLGEALSARVAQAMSSVNRGLPRGNEDPGHVTLVAGAQQDFIGGYRLEGWGWLFRVGGFYPNPEVVLPVAVAAMEHVYTRPPLPVKVGGVKYLWHASVTR